MNSWSLVSLNPCQLASARTGVTLLINQGKKEDSVRECYMSAHCIIGRIVIVYTLLSRGRPDRNDLRIENHYFPSLRKEFRKNKIAKEVLDGTQRREIQ